MKRGVALAFSLLVLVACSQPDDEELANGAIGIDDMPEDCKDRASEEFGVEAREVEILTVESRGGVHTITGAYILGDAKRPFQCQFDPDGKFISIIPT